MTPDISCRSLIQIGLQIPRWLTKWRPCKGIDVSQTFIFHFKWYSLLHFAVCQLLCWTLLFVQSFMRFGIFVGAQRCFFSIDLVVYVYMNHIRSLSSVSSRLFTEWCSSAAETQASRLLKWNMNSVNLYLVLSNAVESRFGERQPAHRPHFNRSTCCCENRQSLRRALNLGQARVLSFYSCIRRSNCDNYEVEVPQLMDTPRLAAR